MSLVEYKSHLLQLTTEISGYLRDIPVKLLALLDEQLREAEWKVREKSSDRRREQIENRIRAIRIRAAVSFQQVEDNETLSARDKAWGRRTVVDHAHEVEIRLRAQLEDGGGSAQDVTEGVATVISQEGAIDE